MSNDSSETDRLDRPAVQEGQQAGMQDSVPVHAAAQMHEQKLPWSLRTALLYTIFLYLAAQIVIGLVASVVLQMLGVEVERISSVMTNSIFLNAALIVGAQLMIALGVVLFVRRRNRGLGSIGLDRFRVSYAGRAVAGYVAYFLLYLVVLSVLSRFIPALTTDQKQDFGFHNPSKIVELLAMGFALIVMPPLVEELLFRGFLYTSLRQKMPFIVSALITSVLFAIGHLQIGSGAPLLWAAALDTFILSLVLCHLRENSNSLWPGIIVHAIKNVIGFSVLYLAVLR